MGIDEVLGPHRAQILRIAQRLGASEVRVFGSVARRSATRQSDVDFLVDFRGPSRSRELAEALERLLHRKVEVVTEDRLHWFIQPQVVAEAVPV